jgi:7-cyano-7-deazaguanine synthase
MTRTFTLLSGGIDSTTALARAIDEFGAETAMAFTFNYGQRHSKEIEAATAICEHYDIPHTVLELGKQPSSAMTDTRRLIPRMSYEELPEGMSPSYHHFRNGQLLSTAAAWAVSMLEGPEEGVLYFGAHQEDAENWAYADCTPEFVGAMANAILVGTYQNVRLSTPFLFMRKCDIIRAGEAMEVPYALTWSCYLGGKYHCRTCPTCRAREDAFEEAGVDDPTEYAVDSGEKEEAEMPIEKKETDEILG